ADAVRSGTTTLLSSLPREAGDASADATTFLTVLGQLWAEGHAVDFAAAGQPVPSRREPLPSYPYQRQRHWADAVDAGSAPDAEEPGTSGMESPEHAAAEPDRAIPQPAPLAARAPATAFSVVNWEEIPGAAASHRSGQLALMVLPQETSRALDL